MKYPGQVEVAHPAVFTTVPPQPATPKPGQLTGEQLKQYFEHGWLMVENFFQPEDLNPVLDDLAEEVDTLATVLHKAGLIKDICKGDNVFRRLVRIQQQYEDANLILIKSGFMPEAVRKVWSHERLLNVAEQVLGTADIQGSPVWNVRFKMPNQTQTTVPWHQDSAYLDNTSYETHQLTAWIPLLDTDAFNGCMQVMDKGHRTGRVATHTVCWKDTWYVDLSEAEMRKIGVDPEKDCITVPVPFGGVLFFNNIIPHQSMNNQSDKCRWSLDLRWQRQDRPVGFYDLVEGMDS